jgi:hypothetical protein
MHEARPHGGVIFENSGITRLKCGMQDKKSYFPLFHKKTEHMEWILLENFLNFASQLTFAEGWIKKFLERKISSI